MAYAREDYHYNLEEWAGHFEAGTLEATTSRDLMLPSAAVQLLPTPMTVNRTSAKAQSGRPTSGPTRGGPSFGLEDVIQLLPTPTAATRDRSPEEIERRHGPGGERVSRGRNLDDVNRWGDYAAAIARHERLTGRPSPAPTEPGPKGNPRLSAAFVEWMMGLPDGWVTDPAIGITRNEQLKALGNGVVPQQAAAAIRHLLGIARAEVAELRGDGAA